MREGAQSEHVRRKSLPVGVLSSLRHGRKRGRENEIYVTESAYLRQRAETSEESGRQKGVKRGLQASQTLAVAFLLLLLLLLPLSKMETNNCAAARKERIITIMLFPLFSNLKPGKPLSSSFFFSPSFFHFWHPASSLDPISLSLLLLPFLLPVPPNPSCLFFSRRAREGERRRRNKTFAVRRQWIFLLPSLLSSR